MLDLSAGRRGRALDQRGGRHDLTRCAEAALERIRPDERVDERMVAEALDRRYLALADSVGEGDARKSRLSVEKDRARAAMALAAGDLGTGEPKILAQKLGERARRRCGETVGSTVD